MTVGQAKLRGTKEERVAAAEAVRDAETQRLEALLMQQERKRAEQWAKLTPEQKEAALNAAKRDMEAYGEMASMFGHEAASALMHLQHTPRTLLTT